MNLNRFGKILFYWTERLVILACKYNCAGRESYQAITNNAKK